MADGSEGETTPGHQEAESNEPKCVRHHQWNKRVIPLQNPKPRQDVELRD